MSATRSASCGTSTECLPGRGRTGFTLVELLWAMTLSLVVMGAVASLYSLTEVVPHLVLCYLGPKCFVI